MKRRTTTRRTDVQTDGRTDRRTVGHWYTIIRPVLKDGRIKNRSTVHLSITEYPTAILIEKTINSPSLYHWISNSHAYIEKKIISSFLYHWISNSHTYIEKPINSSSLYHWTSNSHTDIEKKRLILHISITGYPTAMLI